MLDGPWSTVLFQSPFLDEPPSVSRAIMTRVPISALLLQAHLCSPLECLQNMAGYSERGNTVGPGAHPKGRGRCQRNRRSTGASGTAFFTTACWGNHGMNTTFMDAEGGPIVLGRMFTALYLMGEAGHIGDWKELCSGQKATAAYFYLFVVFVLIFQLPSSGKPDVQHECTKPS